LAPEQVECTDRSGSTPLHFAASVNDVKVLKLLLNDKKSAYMPDLCGLFPVHIAAKLGHQEVLMELFAQCPDSDELLDHQGRNFLHLAVEERQEALVQWVCQDMKFQKAMNARDYGGNTPLHLAVNAKDKTMFAPLILSRRAHFSWVNKDGLTPLDIASAQRKDGFSHWKVHIRIILLVILLCYFTNISRRVYILEFSAPMLIPAHHVLAGWPSTSFISEILKRR
jgi:ankyrin repeat protein